MFIFKSATIRLMLVFGERRLEGKEEKRGGERRREGRRRREGGVV
jgi:hypothetical protein